MPYVSVHLASGLRLLTALAFVGLWWLLLYWKPAQALSIVWPLIALVLTSLATGWLTRSWWALLLPLLVVPAFATPGAYMPGADPEYGVGLFVAGFFVLVAIPSIAAGVTLSR